MKKTANSVCHETILQICSAVLLLNYLEVAIVQFQNNMSAIAQVSVSGSLKTIVESFDLEKYKCKSDTSVWDKFRGAIFWLNRSTWTQFKKITRVNMNSKLLASWLVHQELQFLIG